MNGSMYAAVSQLRQRLADTNRRAAKPAEQWAGQVVEVESEAWYRQTLDTMLEGCQIIGFDWRYLYLNDTAVRQSRQTRQELLGHTMMERYPGIKTTELFSVLQRCMHERTAQSFENEFVYPNGSQGWFELSIQPSPEGLFILSIDITKRKKAEEALRESELRFRTIYQHIPVGITRVSLDFRIEHANLAYCQMLGYDEKELQGKHLSEITHPDILPQNLRQQAQLAKGEIDHYQMEKDFIHKEGHIIHGILDANLIQDVAGKPAYFLGTIVDITARKLAENALRDSERRFAAIFQYSPAAIALTRLSDSRLVDVNAAWEAVTGYTRAEAIGQTPLALNLWVNPEERQQLAAASREQRATRSEARVRRKSGEISIMLMSAELIELGGEQYLLTMAQDVTARKRAEEALRDSKALLDAAGRIARFGGWSVNLTENKVLWSEQVAAIHEMPPGFSPSVEEAINFYAPEWRESITQVFGACAQKGQPYDEEMEIITARGNRVWVRTTGEAMRDETGAIVGVQGAFQDITARKQAEAQLAAQLDELRRWYAATLGREGRIIELKREINALLAQAGQPPRYPSAAERDSKE